MNPPRPEEIHCITINQIPAAIVNAVAVAPVFGQGDTMAKPNPDPISNNSKVVEAAAFRRRK